jgi:hypothetical protein
MSRELDEEIKVKKRILSNMDKQVTNWDKKLIEEVKSRD